MIEQNQWNDNPVQAPPKTKHMCWKELGVRILGAYVLYIILSHLFDPVSTAPSSWSTDKVIFYYFFSYFLHFTIIFVIISLIMLLLAKIIGRFKAIPITNLFNNSLIVSFVISMILLYGGWYATNNSARHHSSQTQTSERITNLEPAPVIAAITSQDSEGMTVKDLDQNALKYLESWLVQTIEQKGKNSYAESGYDPKKFNPKIDASSVYMNIDGKKLAIIKVNMNNTVRSVAVMGLQDTEFLRVTCIRNSNHDIAVFSGECGSKIKEAFKVSIEP